MDIRMTKVPDAGRPWLPSLDVHVEGDELVVHAEAQASWPGWELRFPIPGGGTGEEEVMNWQAARDRELAHWATVRERLGTAAMVDLLTEINAADALCEKAKEEAGGAIDRCGRCLLYQQFGGCREVSGQMSEYVAAGDWEEVRDLVDGYIAHLRALKLPVPATSPVG